MTAARTGTLFLLALAALASSAQQAVLLAGDREGSRHTRAWKEALKAALGGVPGADRVRFAGLADLRGVPGFMRGAVRARFPKEPERWVMLDWEGLFGKGYGLERGACTVLVFGADGRLAHRGGGKEPGPEAVEAAAAAVRALLAPPRP